jgi:hypothetical protein
MLKNHALGSHNHMLPVKEWHGQTLALESMSKDRIASFERTKRHIAGFAVGT